MDTSKELQQYIATLERSAYNWLPKQEILAALKEIVSKLSAQPPRTRGLRGRENMYTEPCTLICDRLTTVIGAQAIKPFTQRLTIESELVYELGADGYPDNLRLRKTGPLLEFLCLNVRDEDAAWRIVMDGREYEITMTDELLAVHTKGIPLDHLHGAEDLVFELGQRVAA